MSILNPMPRSARRTDLVAAPGQTVFGPVDWLAFDPLDVRVLLRQPGELAFSPVGGGVAVTLSASPAGFPIATFAAGRTGGETVRIEGARVHERMQDVTRAGGIASAAFEREADKQAATLMELRRDVDSVASRALQVGEGEAGLVLPADRAGRFIAFDSVSGALVMLPVTINPAAVLRASIIDSSVLGRTLMALANAAAGRTALGASSVGDALFVAASKQAGRLAVDLDYASGAQADAGTATGVTMDPALTRRTIRAALPLVARSEGMSLGNGDTDRQIPDGLVNARPVYFGAIAFDTDPNKVINTTSGLIETNPGTENPSSFYRCRLPGYYEFSAQLGPETAYGVEYSWYLYLYDKGLNKLGTTLIDFVHEPVRAGTHPVVSLSRIVRVPTANTYFQFVSGLISTNPGTLPAIKIGNWSYQTYASVKYLGGLA